MTKLKKMVMIPLAFMMLLLVAASVMAVTPHEADESSNSVISGTIELNISVDGDGYSLGANNNITNVTFHYSNGSVETLIGNNDSNVNNQTFSTWKMNWDTSNIADALSPYSIIYRIYNGTQPSGVADPNYILRNTTTLTGITIDNTVPSNLVLSTAALTVFDSSTSALAGTVDNSSTCEFLFGSNVITGTMTANAVDCTASITRGTLSDGIYSVTLRANDGRNLTTSAATQYQVKFSSDGMQSSANLNLVSQLADKAQKQPVIVLIAALAGFYLLNSKSKTKRRK